MYIRYMNKTIAKEISTCHQCGRGLGPGDQVTIYPDGRHYGQQIHRRGKIGWCHESITGSTNRVLPMADWKETDYEQVVETEGESVGTDLDSGRSLSAPAVPGVEPTIPQSVVDDLADEVSQLSDQLSILTLQFDRFKPYPAQMLTEDIPDTFKERTDYCLRILIDRINKIADILDVEFDNED